MGWGWPRRPWALPDEPFGSFVRRPGYHAKKHYLAGAPIVVFSRRTRGVGLFARVAFLTSYQRPSPTSSWCRIANLSWRRNHDGNDAGCPPKKRS